VPQRCGTQVDSSFILGPMNPRREHPIPLYFQLKTMLVEDILSGRYGADSRLPTEHELCLRYGISRTPVTRALTELADEGVVVRQRRRGTFVNPHWVRRNVERRDLRVMVPDGPWEQQIRRVAGEDLRLSVLQVGLHELHSAVTRAVAAGLGPDLVVLDSVWVHEFVSDGFLLPLEELDPAWIRGEYREDFLHPFVEANSHDGRTYAVQAEADVAGVWYRRAVLDDLGLPEPTTWADLRRAGRELRNRNSGYPLVFPGGSAGGETTTYCLLALLASNRASVLDKGRVTLNSPASVEALRFLRGLADEAVVPVDVVTYEWDRPIRMLARGEAVISFGGSYEARRLAEAAGVSVGRVTNHFNFVPIPAGPGGARASLAGGMVYCLTRQAANPAAAMELLKRLVAPPALRVMHHETGQIPPRLSAVQMLAGQSPFLALTVDMLDHAVTRPPTSSYALVSAQLQVMLEGMITRLRSPRAAVARAAEMISAVTGLPVAGR
jgi:multiple sugar transport system substrate-binding protein